MPRPYNGVIMMMKLGITVAILAALVCPTAEAQTVSVMVLNQTGVQTVLQAAKESAQQRNAPSAIAVVDPAGDLLAFLRMDGVRPASADLAIQKARTAARLRRPTVEIENDINQGRTAFVTSKIMALRGGMPVLSSQLRTLPQDSSRAASRGRPWSRSSPSARAIWSRPISR